MRKRKLRTILKDYKILTITDGFGVKTFDFKHKDETQRRQKTGRYKDRYEAERELAIKAHGIFMEQYSAEQRAKGNTNIAEADKLFDSIYYNERYEGKTK